MVQAGKVRVLGVGNQRSPAFPDLPTITEAGYPALDHAGLIGVFGPKGMPLELRKRVGADIVAAGSTPEVADRRTMGATLVNMSSGGASRTAGDPF